MKILIYTDNVSNNHILYYSLGKLFGKESVFFVNANEINQGAITPEVDLFVMPGGASRYKSAKLDGAATSKIKEYVTNGGRYLGICAGSYMACETTYWAKGQPFEIIKHNELALFQGEAHGPVEQFGIGNNYNATSPLVVELDINGRKEKSLYMGGCTFHAKSNADYSVLAFFSELPEKPAAIISGNYGKGSWLLCSTHPEFDDEAIALMQFDVVGNEYQAFSDVGSNTKLSLNLLHELITQLVG